jgi:putative transposase
MSLVTNITEVAIQRRATPIRHSNPRQWPWGGYHEIMGRRQRYRLVNLERLCWRLGTASLQEVRKNLELTLQETIVRDQMKREACWTESLAVGSKSYLQEIQPLILSRQETGLVQESEAVWVLQEQPIAYGQKRG